MKKTSVLVILMILIPSSFAALPRPTEYCQYSQGYTYRFNPELGIEECLFDDGTACEARAFYEGTCGQEYVKEIPCKEEGEGVYIEYDEKCCESLSPARTGTFGGARYSCELSIFEQFWRWIKSIFS